MSHLLSPSILNADFLKLGEAVAVVNRSQADWLHLDIMDGVFVPNLTFGFPIIQQIAAISAKPLDVHLMITEPNRHIERFSDCGANILTVHYEACLHLHRTVQHIHYLGMKAGVAINPHTPVHQLRDILKDIDLVLIMTVNPGYGGQQFIPHSIEKVREMKSLIAHTGSKALIEVDGGVDDTTAPALLAAGVDILVSGTYIFKSDDPEGRIASLKNIR
ncbi:MAG: ribulose-phosphate 3-epimerase [Bacteroidales bacterium]